MRRIARAINEQAAASSSEPLSAVLKRFEEKFQDERKSIANLENRLIKDEVIKKKSRKN